LRTIGPHNNFIHGQYWFPAIFFFFFEMTNKQHVSVVVLPWLKYINILPIFSLYSYGVYIMYRYNASKKTITRINNIYLKHLTINFKILTVLNIQVFIFFIESIQIIYSTTIMSLTKNNKDVFFKLIFETFK
jgi:hypothetical protein